MQRACAAALVAKGVSVISNPGHSNDDRAALDIIQRLGATVSYKKDELIIQSNGIDPKESAIHCGESGLSIRMFTPLVAISREPITIEGTGSLPSRPMDFFDEVLPVLGVKVKTNQGKLPLLVQGPIVPADIEIDGSLSSQFLTGMLLAYAALNASGVSIKVKNLKSKPYIDLTLDVMRQFGLKVPQNKNYESFYFEASPCLPEPSTRHYTVEGDWSGAAFLLVAGAIAGPITIEGLDVQSTQADKAILQALIESGAGMSILPGEIEVRPMPLKAFHFNATECPDLFPPLVALAACCEGRTVIEGTHRLTHKESNRALTLQEEFRKMGVIIELQDNVMIIQGGRKIQAAQVHSRHDHRIAMASAVAALKAEGEVLIEDAEAINKSYPDFFEHLKQLGGVIKTQQSGPTVL